MRGLWSKQIEFKPQFKIVLCCNDKPNINSYDGGVWRRLRIIEFKSKFVENPKEDWEYKVDTSLDEKLYQWREDFISYLIEYYKIYLNEGLKEPPEIIKYLKSYKKAQNKFETFYEDYLKYAIEKNDNSFILWKDIYNLYKSWHVNYYPGEKIDSSLCLTEYFCKEIFKCEIVNRLKHNQTVRGCKGYSLDLNKLKSKDDSDSDDYYFS